MPQIGYAAWALLAGILIPVLAALSAALGRELGNPTASALITVFVAFLGVLSVAALSGTGLTQFKGLASAPPAQLLAGLCMAFYIVSITYIAPRFGVGNAVMFVVGGQIIASAAIDHFGLFGALRAPITSMRAFGLAVMIAGVVIAQMAANAQRQHS